MESTTTSTLLPDPVSQKSPNPLPLEESESNPPSPTKFLHNIISHAWTIISVPPAVVLLYLNLHEQVIGPELGQSIADTEAVLNILQYVSKVLEISMVLCLANLARQLVQSALISKKGTILALIGAEQVTASPAVLVSRGYMSALKFGLGYFGRSSRGDPRGRGRRLGVLTVSAFLLIAGLLCLSVGPSSAVLLIPARYWFFEKDLMPNEILQQWNIISGSNIEDRSPGYPYIFLNPFEISSEDSPYDIFAGAMWWNYTGNYWQMTEKMPSGSSPYVQRESSERHKFNVISHPVTVNSSTLRRPRFLNIDEKWVGETNFTTLMWDDVEYVGQGNITYKPSAANNPTPTLFKTTMRAVRSTTVCRRERRLSCADSSMMIAPASNSTEWCFQPASPNNEPSRDVLRSRDLLLLVDHSGAKLPKLDDNTDTYEDRPSPRFYITEGHRLQSNKLFTDSILFVFEFEEDLIVCSNTAALTSATATLSGRLYEVFGAEHHKEISYDMKTKTPHPPATFLFQEGWLDYEHAGGVDFALYANATALPSKERSKRGETINPSLSAWANKVINSNNQMGDSIWRPLDYSLRGTAELETLNLHLLEKGMEPLPSVIDASAVEVTVGGPWVTLLSLLNSASQSQYAFLPTSSKSDALIQPIQNYSNLVYSPVSVYCNLYGYSVSPTIILAMTVLTIFVVVACCGSIWQLCRGTSGTVTWSSLPEYLMLGESTATEMGRLSYQQLMKGQKERFVCGVQVRRDESGNYRLVIPTARPGNDASDTENNVGHVAHYSNKNDLRG